MNKQRWKTAEHLAARPYFTVCFADEYTTGGRCYVARNPELPGCMGVGKTPKKAVRDLGLARVEYIYHLLKWKLTVPPPHEPLKNGEVYTVEMS
jgi:predicted RNase H-like HicB family nuclease